jgi:hypothetical protein
MKDPAAEASLSEALRDVGTDLSLLVRQEIGLAKAELKQEAVQAAKGAGMLGGAAYAALMAALMGSFAAAFALGSRWGLGWGALAVTGVWALLAVVLLLTGRRSLSRVSPKPERTLESLKEDARWARHPTS